MSEQQPELTSEETLPAEQLNIEPTVVCITPQGGRVLTQPETDTVIFEFNTPLFVYSIRLTTEQAASYAQAVPVGNSIVRASATDLTRLPRLPH